MNSRLPVFGGRISNAGSPELSKEKTKADAVCDVRFLDGTARSFKISKQDDGHSLLDAAFNHVGLPERELFGLQLAEEPADSARWLDPHKAVKKQFKGSAPWLLNFRVRFFIADPNSLQQEKTRLSCPLSSAVVLASYAVQSELGDHCPSEHPPGYLSASRFLPAQDEDFLFKVESLHPQHRGLKQSEAELCYLNIARTLDFYGVELHSARDSSNADLLIGIASSGLAVFRNMLCSSFFSWVSIIKISFKRKKFFIHLKEKHRECRDCTISFTMLNYRACKNLWRSCVEHHTFFQADTSLPRDKKVLLQHWTLKSKTPAKRSPRLRHNIRKPRPSSMDNLASEMSYITESEDVFYTYRRSIAGSGSDSDAAGDLTATQIRNQVILLVIAVCPILFSQNEEVEGDLLLVRIAPDKDGKFGFNVKVSVISAGKCNPQLKEGDHIVLINGRDISEHTHDQVVMFIKASRESHTKELALLIRRKDTLLLESEQYGGSLETSMAHLKRGLQTGTLLIQFEQLYRKKPGMSMHTARLSQNMEKNRYKDVLPYDATRVVLENNDDDYLNASHVKMEVPAAEVANHYLASQGPLPHTCSHFWQAVWEQQVHIIIMLTTLTERGRPKCHQYWPDPPELLKYGTLQVRCHSEECNLAYVSRELVLTNTETGEERAVSHLQYVAWPDHGVPDDPSDFLDFVTCVQQKLVDAKPLMVHCSAGIGRTGVFITMETAMKLIEKGQPVYPLDLVRRLRDQRAMMVQTSVKYHNVQIINPSLHRPYSYNITCVVMNSSSWVPLQGFRVVFSHSCSCFRPARQL
uniref:protein-tyrosine-phosphatase n=1 Tax=Scleropages formosus TaxID=113540 RepID=A0A8C9THJ2_SCLFO